MAECFSSNKMDLGSYFWSMDLSVKFDGTCTVEKGEKGGHHVSKKVQADGELSLQGRMGE